MWASATIHEIPIISPKNATNFVAFNIWNEFSVPSCLHSIPRASLECVILFLSLLALSFPSLTYLEPVIATLFVAVPVNFDFQHRIWMSIWRIVKISFLWVAAYSVPFLRKIVLFGYLRFPLFNTLTSKSSLFWYATSFSPLPTLISNPFCALYSDKQLLWFFSITDFDFKSFLCSTFW